MIFVSLDDVIKEEYGVYSSFVRGKNIQRERDYFIMNSQTIPMGEILQGMSFEEHFAYFMDAAKNGNDKDLSQIFMLLEDFFLFSNGHDMIFKKKLVADGFYPAPIDELIYPLLKKAIKKEYSNLSVMLENPNRKANLKEIQNIISTYGDVQSLLFLLYYYDFTFPNGWEESFPDNHQELINILDGSEIKIGDFLNLLIDYKCRVMSDIFDITTDPILKEKYLKKVEALKETRKKETQTFAHIGLPVTFFLNHTFKEYLDTIKSESPVILGNKKPKVTQKIILPSNYNN